MASLSEHYVAPDTSNYVAAILATSQEAGEEYAKVLGIENYRVITEERHAQGLRIRAIIITPGYFSRVEQSMWKASSVLQAAEQSFSMSSSIRG